ncbi:hypothetical protein OEZ85_007664 [Tetradesmus obliquus]|uniref:3'-5' exonuclease n=1 Tax=Tetradesmus obliquus TaxID=3088 RepID=A0ABY8TGU1_TETOB|nr:hypothetical protein OEZ85_007664 [Tetradesmus obliquus]
MLIARLQAGPLRLQAQAKDTASSKATPAAAAGGIAKRGDLTFTGELRFAASHREANAWLDELLQLADACSSSGPLVIGIDTETAVTWGQQQRHTPTSLLQLCYHAAGSPQPVCLLLPLHRLGLIPRLLQVLQHPCILKVGIGVAHDMMDLLRSYEMEGSVQGMLDLSWLASQAGVFKEGSAQDAARQQAMQQAGIKTFQQPLQWGLAGLLQATSEFSLAKSKRVTMSNWAQVPLSEKQLQYAACDAYAGLMAFHTLWLQQWQQLLQRGTKAAQLQYDNMIANALDKAAAGDGSDYDLVGAGAPVVDAGADAAAGGMMWP